ncbi:hypothetical protein JCM33374_g3952 [Metschnikowia sp. JCM 33374]|nr:hypothetical protein JCM33374_g3952 [Metschnikowia sp. JCM 33374]
MFGGLPYMLIFLAVACATTGCSPSRVDYTGFTVRFYKYKYWGTAGWGPVFFTSGYQKKLETTIHRVTEINFQHSNITDYNIVHGQIYGYNTTISNFSAELSAYYKAPVSGVYTFRLAADNGASLQFGRGTSCCNDASGSVSGRFYINTLGPRGGGGSTDKNVNIASFHLQKGVYYPLKIVTFNWRGNSGLNLKVTDPQGNIIPDFGSHVFKAHFDESLCYTTITSLWRRSFRSTTTKTATPTNTVIVYVPRPKPRRAARYVPQIVEVTSSAPSVVETSSYRYPHAEAPSSVSQIMETSRFISLSAEVSSSVSQIVETTSSAPPIVETTSSAPPIVETTSSAPQIVETTSSAPPIVETTSSAPPIVETTSSAPPTCEKIKFGTSTCEKIKFGTSNCGDHKFGSPDCEKIKFGTSTCEKIKLGTSTCENLKFGSPDCGEIS